MNYRRLLVLFALFLSIAAGGAPGAAEVITVTAGGDLQQAIDRARPGDVIVLQEGATYTGNFLLPVKPGQQYITIRTAASDGLPRAGSRVQPVHAARLAKLRSPNRESVMRTAAGAHHWRLQWLEFLPTQGGSGDIIALGDGSRQQHDRAQVPQHLIVDRCYIHGEPQQGQKRGIALNSGATIISGSYISDIKAKGQDAQAIAGWNGPGPYLIENNYLEAAAENFLLGGADPSIDGLVIEDVVFRRNHLSKPVAWREAGWQVKNLLELKNARRVLVEANLMEYVWRAAQTGYAILLTPRNQDGRAPWSTVQNVTIRYNVVRYAGGGIQITGKDNNHPSGPTRDVTVTDNLFYDIDDDRWGGTGAFLVLGDGPSNVTVAHNTVRQSGNIVIAYGGSRRRPTPSQGFRFQDNIVLHNRYGVHGADRAVGRDTLDAYFPGAVFDRNGVGGGDARLYPPGNVFVPRDQFDEQFVDVSRRDFRLRPGSRFRAAASDGKDLGADLAALARAMGVRTSR